MILVCDELWVKSADCIERFFCINKAASACYHNSEPVEELCKRVCKLIHKRMAEMPGVVCAEPAYSTAYVFFKMPFNPSKKVFFKDNICVCKYQYHALGALCACVSCNCRAT